ncbi:homeobox protein prospero-like [Daphnia pulex]|uniref:homeobox protein prospero-like n=1 Tax=Daphnia pulex TaxID=6669 RepID=UPI001EDE7891|nr:homeobox protein prospero-like [Daphnia pulex]
MRQRTIATIHFQRNNTNSAWPAPKLPLAPAQPSRSSSTNGPRNPAASRPSSSSSSKPAGLSETTPAARHDADAAATAERSHSIPSGAHRFAPPAALRRTPAAAAAPTGREIQQRAGPAAEAAANPPARPRRRQPLPQRPPSANQFRYMRSNMSNSELSHVSQAHAAYLDANRRMLMEQQQQRQQAPIKSVVQQMQQQQPLPTAQQPVLQMTSTPKNPVSSPNNTELKGLAEKLKSELASSLAQLVDNTLSRFAAAQQQQQRSRHHVIVNSQKSSANSVTGEESELSKLQRGRVIDRGMQNGDLAALGLTSTPFLRTPYGPLPHHLSPQQQSPNSALNHIVNSIGAGIHPAAGLANIGQQFTQQQQQKQQQKEQDSIEADAAEQNEALSLVASPKKRRFTPAASNNNNKTTSSERNSSPAPGHRDNAETRPYFVSCCLSKQSCPPFPFLCIKRNQNRKERACIDFTECVKQTTLVRA